MCMPNLGTHNSNLGTRVHNLGKLYEEYKVFYSIAFASYRGDNSADF